MTSVTTAVESLAFPQEKKQFIIDVLDPILEPMVNELLTKLPDNPTDFMISYLHRKNGTVRALGIKDRNSMLKRELAGMHEFVNDVTVGAAAKEIEPDQLPESEPEEDDDEGADDLPMPMPVNRGPRASVSAEAYGDWNKVREFVPPVHVKSDEQKARLHKILSASFMFANLEPKEMDIVLLAMVEKQFEAGARIITEGDDGDMLFVIEDGAPVCKKKVDGVDTVVKTCVPGDVFGELALLYNCPRAATVEAVDTCKCWGLDRETFSHIVKESATTKTSMYKGFLQEVSWFMQMDVVERSQITDALKPETFKKDDFVMKQHEEGNKLYIVEEGTLVAFRDDPSGQRVEEEMHYQRGDYFGELALLKNQARAASVQVTSDVAKLLSLDRKTFTSMIGPLSDILKRKEYS